MGNAIVHAGFKIDVPEDLLEVLVGREDDGSDAWFEAAMRAAEQAVREEPSRWMEYVAGEPDVEAIG